MWEAIGGQLLSGLMNNMFAENMQEDQQSFNAEMMANASAFNSAEALKNRDFVERMSGSAHTREVQDLKNAGLNPMLSLGRNGASTPSVGGASVSPVSSGIATPGRSYDIPAAMQTASNIELQSATAARTRAEEAKTKAEEDEIKARTPTHAVSIDQMRQNIDESVERIKKIIQETSTSAHSAANLAQQTTNLQEIIPQIRATVEQLRAHTRLAGAQTTLAGAQTGQAQAQTGLAKEQTGEVNQRIQANLPKVEAALKTLERIQKDMSTPRLQQDESTHEGYLGAFSAALRALNPLNGFLNQR